MVSRFGAWAVVGLIALASIAWIVSLYRNDYSPTANINPNTGLPHMIYRFHDGEMGVTCWYYGDTNGGLACLPDQDILGR